MQNKTLPVVVDRALFENVLNGRAEVYKIAESRSVGNI